MILERRISLSAKPVRQIINKLQRTESCAFLGPDPFLPTAGRWLWNELRKQKEHVQKFDLKALEHVIVKAAGSTAGVTAIRFAEGASNKIFPAVGEQRLIVKIPDPERNG